MLIASTQFSLKELGSSQEFWERCEKLILEASQKNAKAILFPEYFTLSWLISLYPQENFFTALHGFLPHKEYFQQKFTALAKKHQIWIIAGTVPEKFADNKLVNRAYVFAPDGIVLFQDKLQMTRFESEEWDVHPGNPDILIFDIHGVSCAITICYDTEFPSISKEIAKAGVELIFSPSCTDDVHGYWRVRHCAHARTVENQAYVAMANIVEGHKKFPEIESHYGRAGIFSPCDVQFPEAGIVAEGQTNQEGLAVGEVSPELIREVRKNGTVLNSRDSKKQIEYQLLFR